MAQAGLEQDAPALTMRDRSELFRELLNKGHTASSASAQLDALGVPGQTLTPPASAGLVDDPVEDDFGLVDRLWYGTRRMAGMPIEGVGKRTGIEAIEDFGAAVGPSEEQEQARAEAAAKRAEAVASGEMSEAGALAADVGDAVVESGPQLIGAMGAAAGGATIGSVLGPGGAVVGGAIGAAAYGIASMFGEAYDKAEAEGLDTSDPEIQKRIDAVAIGGGALDAVTPFKVLRMVKPAAAAAIGGKALAKGSIKKGALKKGAEEFVTEGVTEVGQEALQAILLDKEIVEALTPEQRRELYPEVLKEHGRDFAVAFLAGGITGGAAGAAGGAISTAAQNAEVDKISKAAGEVAAERGVDPVRVQIENLEPLERQELAQEAQGLRAAKRAAEDAEQVMKAAPGVTAAEDNFKRLNTHYERLADDFAVKRGGKTKAEVQREAKVEEDSRKADQATKAKNLGITPAKDVNLDDHQETLSKLDDEVNEIRALNAKLRIAQQPKRRLKLEAQLDEKIKAASKTRATLGKSVEGRDPAAAKKEFIDAQKSEMRGAKREATVDRQVKRIQKSEDPVAYATRIVEGAKGDKAKQDTDIKKEINRLERKLDDVTSPEEADTLEQQIEAERAKLTSDKPLVEAARMVLEDAGVDLSEETGIEQSAAPSRTEPSQSAAAGEKAPAGAEVDAAAQTPEDAATQAAVVRKAERDLAVKQTKIDEDQRELAELEATEAPARKQAAVRRRIQSNEKAAAEIRQRIAANQPAAPVEPVQGPAAPADTRQAQLDAQYGVYQTTAEIPADSPMRQSTNEGYVDLLDNFGKTRTTPYEAQQWLQKWTESSGFEATIAIDADGRVLGAGTMNEVNAAPFPLVAQQAMRDPARQVRFMHSHPKETPLSSADVRMLKKYPGMSVMEAVLPSGRVVRATPAEKAIDLDNDLVQLIQNAAAPEQGDMSVERFATVRQEAMLRALGADGYISYNPDRRLENQKEINDAAKRATDALQGAPAAGVGTDAGTGTQQQAAGTEGPGQVRPEQSGRTGGDTGGRGRDVAAGRDPVYPEFRAEVDKGTPTADLIQRPEFKAAIGEMMTLPSTANQPGFWSPEWQKNREYNIGGRMVKGVEAANIELLRQGIDLAATELQRPSIPLRYERKVTIITGPPASGKSTQANDIAYSMGAAIIDSDEAKKIIPEFGRGEGANAVHEESKRLMSPVEDVLRGAGANVVIPKVGHEKGSIDKIAQKFKDEGYEVNLVDLKVESPEAMRRMLGRFGSTGRLIPPSYLLNDVGDNPSSVHQEMASEGKYDGYAQLDGMGAPDARPEVISHSGTALSGTAFKVPEGQRPERGPAGGAVGPEGRGETEGDVAQGIDPYAPPLPEPMAPGQELRSVEPTMVRRVAQEVFNNIPTEGRAGRGAISMAVKAGEITPQSLANSIAVAADNNNQNAGVLLRNVAPYAFDPTAGDKTDQERQNMALAILNEVSKAGFGKFVRRQDTFYDPSRRAKVSVSTIGMDADLQKNIGATPQTTTFMPPMEDPNDVSELFRKEGILLDGPALERAQNTARHLQKQKYVLDQEYINSLEPDDLISAKSLAVVKNDGHMAFLRARARQKLDRLKGMAADWGDKELGFTYFVDKKGRMYPSGEFHHQSGDAIKAAFKIKNEKDGTYTSLKEYNSVDHTGSGWQVSVAIAKDDVAAPLVNLQPGTATIPGKQGKGDMYTAVRAALEARIRNTFPESHPFVAKILNDPETDGVKSWNGKAGRNILKTPVLAVNYSGGQSNFRTALINTYFSEFERGDPAMEGFWHNAADMGYEAVGDIAPAAKAWKDWAVAGLQQGIAAAEAQGKPLSITVGPDGKYQVRKFTKLTKQMIAQDNRNGSEIKKVEASWSEPSEMVDPQKTARNMFSQLIQGFDAAIMHESVRNYIDATGGAHVVTNHDSYTVPPKNAGILAASVRKAMLDVMTMMDPGEKLRQDILDQTGVDIGAPPPPGALNLEESLPTSSPVFIEENELTGQQEERPAYVDLQGNPIEADTAQGIDFDALFSEFDIDPDMRARSSITQMYSGAETPTFASNRQAAEYLQELTPADDRITDFKAKLTPEQRTKIAKTMAAEAKAALDFRGEGSAADWYTSAMSRAMEIATIKYPQMVDDAAANDAGFATADDARFAFLYAMSTASQNLDVRANAIAALKAYDKLLANIKEGNYDFGEDVGTGSKAPAMQANFDKFGSLFRSKQFGTLSPQDRVTAMRLLFNEKKPLRDWEAAFKKMGASGFSVGQTAKDVEVYGSAFLGPKIGNGFYQNLNGNYNPITIDLWARRTWGRLTGKSIGMEDAFEPQRDRLRQSTLRSFRAAGDADLRAAVQDKLKAARSEQKAAEAELKRLQAEKLPGVTAAKRLVTKANKKVTAIEARLSDVANERVPEAWKPEYETDRDAYLQYAGRLKRAWDKSFKAMSAAGMSKEQKSAAQPTWAKAAKIITASQTTPLDQVQNATQRKDIEATMREALDILSDKGVNITPADLQAILWYPEKDLWNSLSSEQQFDEDGDPIIAVSDLNESYDTVLADILEGEGFNVEGFKRNASGRSAARGARPEQSGGNGQGSGRAGADSEGLADAASGIDFTGGKPKGKVSPYFASQEPDARTALFKGLDEAIAATRADMDAGPSRSGYTLPPTIQALNQIKHRVIDSEVTGKLLSWLEDQPGGPEYQDFEAKARQQSYNILKNPNVQKKFEAELGIKIDLGDPGAVRWSTSRGKANDAVMERLQSRKARAQAVVDIAEQSGPYRPRKGRVAHKVTPQDIIAQVGRAEWEKIQNVAAGVIPENAPEAAPMASAPDVAAGRDVQLDVPGYMKGQVEASSTMKDYGNRMLTPAKTNRDFWAWVDDNFFNRFAPIKRLEKAMRGDGTLATGADSMFKMAEIAANDSGRTYSLMFEGAADITSEGGYGVAAGTKGLRQIFDMVGTGQDMVDWMSYMIAKDAKGRKALGFKVPLSDAEMAAALTKAESKPQFEQAAAEWKKYNDANIDFLVTTGRISKDQAKALKSNPNYVPLYRSKDPVTGKEIQGGVELDPLALSRGGGRGGKGEIAPGRNPGIRKQKGGDVLQIDNLLTNMMKNSEAIAAAGMRNMAANKVFKAMGDVGMSTKVRANKVKTKPNGAIKMWDKGNEYWVVPTTPEAIPVMTALTGLEPVKMGKFLQLASDVGSVFRQGITLSPAFMIRNAIRGMVSAGVITGWNNVTMHNNTLTGFRRALRKDDATKAFMRQSGMGDYRFGNQDVGFGKNDILIEYGLGPKTVGFRLREFMNKLEDVGMATELADRMAVYENLRAKGVPDTEAAWQAQNVINYGRKGGLPELRALLPMVPFLNARLQGLARLAEGVIDEDSSPKTKRQALQRMALAAAPLMAFGAAAWAWNNGDDERREKYKAEPLWRRQNYHIIYAGDTTLLIPKAFEIGHLFSTLPEMFADAMVNDMGDEVPTAMRQLVGQTLLFNAIPAAALPIIEGSANYSFFTGQPIVGRREQDLRAEDRTANTTPLARFVGRTLGISDLTKVSPTMIEHFFQGYGGAYYNAAGTLMDIVGAEAGLIPSKPAGAFGDVPIASNALDRVLGSMVKDTSSTTDKYLSEFYENKDHITQIYRSAKAAAAAGNVEYARELLTEVAPNAAEAYKIVNKAGAQMGKINAAIREVQNDRKISAGEKRAKIRKLTDTRNKLARTVAGIVDKLEEDQGQTFKGAA